MEMLIGAGAVCRELINSFTVSGRSRTMSAVKLVET